MSRQNYIFTSESVSEGHPDKLCDRISDAVLDAFLKEEPVARVACETFATTNRVVIGGEVGLSSKEKLTEYMQERCRLDVYHPVGKEGYPTIVWFHGGGLKAGNRSVPAALKNKGVAVVSVNYRLHPKVKSPVYIEAVSYTHLRAHET